MINFIGIYPIWEYIDGFLRIVADKLCDVVYFLEHFC